MQVVWNALSFPALVAMVFALIMGAMIVATGHQRRASILLAAVLALEGITWGAGIGVIHFMGDRVWAVQAQAVYISGLIANPAVYLLLLGELESPLTRPLRRLPVRVGIVGLTLVAELYWLTHVTQFIPRMVHPNYAIWEAEIGPGGVIALAAIGLVSLFALAAATDAFRRATRGTVARERMRWYVIAFGTHDVLSFLLLLLLPSIIAPLPPSGTWWDAFYMLTIAGMILLYVALLAYGILRTQIFDVDLRLKRTLSRGTLAAVFIAVFFVVANIAQNYLTTEYGYLAGGAAAGLLLFAVSPLERAAQRVADAAMPRTTGSADYLAYRRMHVYRGALEEALRDGGVTRRERAMLDRLRAELGIDATAADLIERELIDRSPKASPG